MVNLLVGLSPLFKRTGTNVYRKEGNLSPVSRYMEFGVYSMKKQGVGGKCLLLGSVRRKLSEQELSTFSSFCFGVKTVYNYGHWHTTATSTTTEYTELQPLLSGVHSVMRVKLALAGEGGGCTTTPSYYIYNHQ
jgi:hypothetical protein